MAEAKNILLQARSTGSTSFDIKYYPVTIPKNVIGLVGTDGKIKTNMFPSFVIGGMKFVQTITFAGGEDNGNASYLLTQATNWIAANMQVDVDDITDDMYSGKYFVARKTQVVNFDEGHIFQSTSGDGYVGNTITLQTGDWLIINNKNATEVTWGLVNNKYQEATYDTKGVVTLIENASDIATPKGTGFAPSAKAVKTFAEGLFTVDRIPVLPASKITSGVLGVDRIPELPQTKIEGLSASLASKAPAVHEHPMNQVTGLNDALAGFVPRTRTINGKALTSNITLDKEDIDLKNVKNVDTTIASNITFGGSPGDFLLRGEGGNVTYYPPSSARTQLGIYSTATSTDAKEGTSNTKYMTPLRTKEAIDFWGSLTYYASEPIADDVPEGKIIAVEVDPTTLTL